MLIPAIVFVVVIAVVLAVYHVGVQRTEQAERDVVASRLTSGLRSGRTAAATTLVKSAHDVSAVPVLDRLLAPYDRLSRPLALSIAHADLKLTVGALLATSALAGLVAYVATYALTFNQLVAAPVACVAAGLPIWFVRFKATQRIRKFEEQFPEAIDLISRALRAGHAFSTALSMAADESPQPVREEFRRLHDEQNFGRPLPDAMRDFARRIPVLDAKFFVTAVLTQRESGGNLSEVLDNLARVIRERFRVKRQIRVISAHGRMTAGVLISLPPFLAFSFMAMSPNHLRTMTSDPLGWWMIGAAIALQLTGSLVIKKLINIEY